MKFIRGFLALGLMIAIATLGSPSALATDINPTVVGAAQLDPLVGPVAMQHFAFGIIEDSTSPGPSIPDPFGNNRGDCQGSILSAAYQMNAQTWVYLYRLFCNCGPDWDVGYPEVDGFGVPLGTASVIPVNYTGAGPAQLIRGDGNFSFGPGLSPFVFLGGGGSVDQIISGHITATHVKFYNANGIFGASDVFGFAANAPPTLRTGQHLGGSNTSFTIVAPGQPVQPPQRDNVPPTTTLTQSPAPNAAGWNNTSVTATFNATDTAQSGVTPSGVNHISVDISTNGGPFVHQSCPAGPQCVLTLTADGIYDIRYHAMDNAGNQEAEKTHMKRIDRTPPQASCLETTNPSGKNVPVAGPAAGNSGQNPDGFYQLNGSDALSGLLSIVVRDSGSAFLSNPFNSGDKVKVTQAPGVTPSDVRPGPGVIVSHLKLRGDAILRVTDVAGNMTEVSCLVPPPPK